MTKDETLKHCPFCGRKAEISKYGLSSYSVVCENCGAEAPARLSRDEAIDAWNRRAYEALYNVILEYQMKGYSRAEVLHMITVEGTGL